MKKQILLKEGDQILYTFKKDRYDALAIFELDYRIGTVLKTYDCYKQHSHYDCNCSYCRKPLEYPIRFHDTNIITDLYENDLAHVFKITNRNDNEIIEYKKWSELIFKYYHQIDGQMAEEIIDAKIDL